MNRIAGTNPRGIRAVHAMFERARQEKRAAFLPYFPVGFPNYADSLAIMTALAEAGVDGMEIGIPFSDPLADGPTIQAATQTALEGGTTVISAFQAVEELRSSGHDMPLFLMGYLNPILSFGTERFIEKARAVGADGLIIPDLPPEEATEFIERCESSELALVFFIAPTSNVERIKLVTESARGFIYVVSLTGTTGARSSLPDDLPNFIQRLRHKCDLPLVLGFGISNAEQAGQMDGLLDGFIVGSAMVTAAQKGISHARQLAEAIVSRKE